MKLFVLHSERRRIPFIVKMWSLCFLLLLHPISPVEASSPKYRTVVSLTFDDGLRQSAAIVPLLDSGLKATFYVNSNRIRLTGSIDNNNWLTKGELDILFGNGYEIGGHTISHVDLATLDDAGQLQAICDDLKNLREWYGDEVHSFAYPYGSTGPTTQSLIAGGCPGTYGVLDKPIGKYESARTTTGIGCQGCPWGVPLPPANPYYLPTVKGVLSTDTLADIQKYVLQAEAYSGGWVVLLFHSVCDGCDTGSITQETLINFLTWLKDRESQGTYVRTVHQVMSGDYPPALPPPPLGPNMIINSSLEVLASNGFPYCWQVGDYGVSTATWTHTSDAYAGDFAEKLQITSYTSGDRKLLPKLDAGQRSGQCAPSVNPGTNYQIEAYYKSTISAWVPLFYLDANGVWKYWRTAPSLQAASDWTHMSYVIGPLPEGAQALSFGIALTGVGTLTTDEYLMTEVLDSNVTPTFVGGAAALTVAQDSLPLDLKPNLHVSDTDSGQTLTWTLSAVPAHGTVTISGATAGTGASDITPGGIITYQPAAGYNGSDAFTIQVSDGTASEARVFTVTVTPLPNVAPTFVGGTAVLTVAQDSPPLDLKPNLHVSDTDSGQTLTWTLNAVPAHGTVTISGATAGTGASDITPGGIITYQPAPGYNGSDTFTVHVSDGTAGEARVFTVTVSPLPNVAPVFVGGSTTILVHKNSVTDLKPYLHVSDKDSGQTLTWSQAVAPIKGALTISGATASSGSTNITPHGTISYRPKPAYLGPDTFTIQVSDGVATAYRTFNVTVSK